LSKVLATRLKRVIGKLIAIPIILHIPNGDILDGVLIINGLVDLANRRKETCILLKISFEKIYYLANWTFLEYMMGFEER